MLHRSSSINPRVGRRRARTPPILPEPDLNGGSRRWSCIARTPRAGVGRERSPGPPGRVHPWTDISSPPGATPEDLAWLRRPDPDGSPSLVALDRRDRGGRAGRGHPVRVRPVPGLRLTGRPSAGISPTGRAARARRTGPAAPGRPAPCPRGATAPPPSSRSRARSPRRARPRSSRWRRCPRPAGPTPWWWCDEHATTSASAARAMALPPASLTSWTTASAPLGAPCGMKRAVARQVLGQRATERHVHHLHPATDAERRRAAAVGLPEQVDLERVAVGLEPVDRLARLLTVPGRLDVPSADQHQRVHGVEQLGGRTVVAGEQERRATAGAADRVDVVLREPVAAHLPVGHAAGAEVVRDDADRRSGCGRHAPSVARRPVGGC